MSFCNNRMVGIRNAIDADLNEKRASNKNRSSSEIVLDRIEDAGPAFKAKNKQHTLRT